MISNLYKPPSPDGTAVIWHGRAREGCCQMFRNVGNETARCGVIVLFGKDFGLARHLRSIAITLRTHEEKSIVRLTDRALAAYGSARRLLKK